MVVKVDLLNFSSQMHKFNGLEKPSSEYYLVPNSYLQENNQQETPEKKKKNKAIKIIGGVVGTILLILGTARVTPKTTIQKTEKIKDFFIKKSEEVTTSSNMAIFYRKILARTRNIAEKSRGFNNFVSFKDIWFKRKITDKSRFLKRISNYITKFFDNVGQKVVRKSYSRSLKKFNKLNHLYTNFENELLKDGSTAITIHGVTKTKAEWVKVLAEKRQKMMEILENEFSNDTIAKRNKTMKSFMSNLEEEVWEASFGTKGNMRKKNTYFTFWADKFLAENKLNFSNDLNKIKSSIKFGHSDKAKVCEEILSINRKFIHPQDISSEKQIREVNKLLSRYKAMSPENNSEEIRLLENIITQKLDELLKILEHGQMTFNYDEKILNAIKIQNTQIKNVITSREYGCIDEINEIYRAILNEKDYKLARNASKNAVNSLTNSIRKESNDYFDKLRDWTLGAAPTDVLGVLSGFASMGGALALTNNREKRKSIALKLGIPALGGTAVMMYMTARLTSGFKGLAAGIFSSLVLNKIGTFVDNKFLSSKN